MSILSEKSKRNGMEVIGQDGKTVILKYGSNIIRAHETHVQEKPYSFIRDTEEGKTTLLDMLKYHTLYG